TQWGKKSFCSVHGLHAGKIESCPEWDKITVTQQGSNDDDGQLTYKNLEPAMEWVQRTEEEIRDYSFSLREIDRIKGILKDAGEGTVGAYGIDASLPKGKGTTSDKTHREAVKRERYWERLRRLEASIQRVDRGSETITDDKERAVLECIMDGVRMNMIARHVGVSRSYLNDIKRELIKKMARAMYGEDRHNAC
ncbi:hypothetical protein ACFLFF_28855, partial [Brevibacillus reuszeri]|uniref:hypothetical protein n=1 Tax=Brevibacillus reuszeri TaxID=54915 RepID=UPI00366DDD7B